MTAIGPVRTAPNGLAVLRDSKIPALLLSPGFITNMEDVQLLSDPAYQEKVAAAVVASMK